MTFTALLEEPEHYDLAVTTFDAKFHPLDELFVDSKWSSWIDPSLMTEQIEQMMTAENLDDAILQMNHFQTETWHELPFVKLGHKKDVISYQSILKGLTDFYGGFILWNVSLEE